MSKTKVILDILLNINKPIEVIENGEPITTWELHFQAWAGRNQVSRDENESIEAMQRVSSDYTEFTIRYPIHTTVLPSSKMQVVEVNLGYEYDIENVRTVGRNQFLILVCKQKQQR